MKLYPDCDYFGDECDNEFAPGDNSCETCYRFDICFPAYLKDLKEGRIHASDDGYAESNGY